MVWLPALSRVVRQGAAALLAFSMADPAAAASVKAAPSLFALATPAGDVDSAVAPQDPAVAVSAHLDRVAGASRLSFDLSKTATARAYALENPDRIVVETSAINFQIDPEVGHLHPDGGGPVRSFRFGQFAPGKSRIVIDLTGPAKVEAINVEPIAAGDPARLSIQIAKCDRASFRDSVAHASAVEPVASTIVAVTPPSPIDSRPVIVLDPGHGGVDPGASGLGGVVEKYVVYDFAAALAEKLRAGGRYKVVMTRAGDAFVSLGDRVRIARDAKASLFVSVHADTVLGGGDVTGATVYTVSDRASDTEAARVAESENKADEAAGLETAPDATDVSDILADLTRRETRTFSHAFQRTLAGYWQKIARLNKNPERSAGFQVLKAPDVPSVLLELGYLSNEKDVANFSSAVWRERATSSIVASIDTFFSSRRPDADAGVSDSRAGNPDKTAVVVLQPHP